MYINHISIQNIRSFESLEMDFGDSKAGWHVILGTNGTGKSTLIRSVALALVGEKNAQPLTYRYNWNYWLRIGTDIGRVKLSLGKTDFELLFKRTKNPAIVSLEEEKPLSRDDIFSAAYGSSRRITNENNDYDNIWNNFPKLAAHLSCFGEDVTLHKSIEWLNTLVSWKNITPQDGSDANFQKIGLTLIKNIEIFINKSNLLPSGVSTWQWEEQRLGSLLFTDKNNYKIPIIELSDGYRSILSLTLELIRQISNFLHYGIDSESFFVDNGEYLYINTSGVVLIDEIDSHLHPTWQAQIGDWFTKYFPNIQFIVTTHSPIICRSASTGTIWKLSNTEKSTTIEQIVGDQKNQLLYGNILDAYETELFGEDISISQKSLKMLKRLARLNIQKQVGRITTEEEIELKSLQQIFQTDAHNTSLAD